jgi:hypothetical protein
MITLLRNKHYKVQRGEREREFISNKSPYWGSMVLPEKTSTSFISIEITVHVCVCVCVCVCVSSAHTYTVVEQYFEGDPVQQPARQPRVASFAGGHWHNAGSVRAACPWRWVSPRGSCALRGVRTGANRRHVPARRAVAQRYCQ